ncbi:MAG: gliding motility-associated C-terminal domain-containing protein [Bacteroidota bacterium]|nr:gliding motility-associated C-terminal domain-containing protein [Bacteroidota bacterium]
MLTHKSRLVILFLLLTSLAGYTQIPSFTLPDTVCVNAPVNISNTSAGGATWFWNFCVADLNQTIPQATNLGNVGNVLSWPVFMDLAEDNGNYYAFVVNHTPGALIRLDFGNSFLNTPTATDLGNFGGILAFVGNEGVQVVKNNGRWYAIIVGGGTESATTPHIVRVDIGPTITNNSPVATDWGNPPGANLNMPIDLYLFTDPASPGNWYGFTVNADNNTVTLFNFGTDFSNPPTATNLGNVGGKFVYPDGIFALNDAGNWHVFIAEGNAGKITRLDFGNSLLNAPTAVDLGNPGGYLTLPRDMAIIKFCDQVVGFVVDVDNGKLVRLDFHNDVLSVPTAVDMGNIGNFNTPHSISKFFRVGADIYCFVPNVHNNTITRIRFAGCTSASSPSFSGKDPPAISYSSPGTYHVNMMMDEGLPSEATFCRSVVVMGPPVISLGRDTSLCEGDSLILRYPGNNLTYLWQDGSTADSLLVRSAAQYQLAVTTSYGCTANAAIGVQFKSLPSVSTLPDTSFCQGSPLLLKTSVQNTDSVRWTPSAGLSDPTMTNPGANPATPTRYIVKAYHGLCTVSDTVMVKVLDTPVISISKDTIICKGDGVQLQVNGANDYAWSPSQGLDDPGSADPIAAPSATARYKVLATGSDGCKVNDSILITVKPPDQFDITPQTAGICTGDSVLLKLTGADPAYGDYYQWVSNIGSQDPGASTVLVYPNASGSYQAVAYDKICNLKMVLKSTITVNPPPDPFISKSNDLDCITGEATLTASGGVSYAWYPAGHLSDPSVADPIARPDSSTWYYVRVTDSHGCSSLDSIELLVTKAGTSIGYPVASAFTPNGDGHNDCFGIKYWGAVKGFEMAVFDRMGARVFYTKDPGGCWDGTFNGQPQPTGTYVYYIKAETLCGPAFKKGTVQLIR